MALRAAAGPRPAAASFAAPAHVPRTLAPRARAPPPPGLQHPLGTGGRRRGPPAARSAPPPPPEPATDAGAGATAGPCDFAEETGLVGEKGSLLKSISSVRQALWSTDPGAVAARG